MKTRHGQGKKRKACAGDAEVIQEHSAELQKRAEEARAQAAKHVARTKGVSPEIQIWLDKAQSLDHLLNSAASLSQAQVKLLAKSNSEFREFVVTRFLAKLGHDGVKVPSQKIPLRHFIKLYDAVITDRCEPFLMDCFGSFLAVPRIVEVEKKLYRSVSDEKIREAMHRNDTLATWILRGCIRRHTLVNWAEFGMRLVDWGVCF